MRVQKAANFINFQKKFNFIAMNDMHSSTTHLSSYCARVDEFYKTHKNEPVYSFSGGDVFLDSSASNEVVAKNFSNRLNAFALGNHDLENGNLLYDLSKTLGALVHLLSINVNFSKKTNLSDIISSSVIVENNGEKVGVIGVSPFDFRKSTQIGQRNDFIFVEPFDKTIEKIKKEVEQLEQQGINKIVLLAHCGEFSKDGINYYSEFAKISGIDLIIGGHDHREVDRWELSQRNEPVKIISSGKSSSHGFGENLDYYIQMELDFDDDGIIIPKNSKTEFIKTPKDENREERKIIYTLNSPYIAQNRLTKENPVAEIVADAKLWWVNNFSSEPKADFAFINSGTIRGDFEACEVDDEIIKSVVPFTQTTLMKAKLSKRQIINTLSYCAQSRYFEKISPGIMQVSGLRYKINPGNSISDVQIIDNETGQVKYSLDDLSPDDEIVCVYDIFLAQGPAGMVDLIPLSEDKVLERYDEISKQKALEAYLSQNPKLSKTINKRIQIL